MDRRGFFGFMGLGALAALIPKRWQSTYPSHPNQPAGFTYASEQAFSDTSGWTGVATDLAKHIDYYISDVGTVRLPPDVGVRHPRLTEQHLKDAIEDCWIAGDDISWETVEPRLRA